MANGQLERIVEEGGVVEAGMEGMEGMADPALICYIQI